MSDIDPFQSMAERIVKRGLMDSYFEIDDPDDYKVDDFEIFIDSDGGDYWMRINDLWYMIDSMSMKVSSSDYEWNEIVWNYGPLFFLGEY